MARDDARRDGELTHALNDPKALAQAVRSAGGAVWFYNPGDNTITADAAGPFDLPFEGDLESLARLFDAADREDLCSAFLHVRSHGGVSAVARRGGRIWRFTGAWDGARALGLCTPASADLLGPGGRRDALTFLLNRRAFLDEVDERRAKGERGVLALADIDRFRRLNDAFGHIGADVVLVAVARRLEEAGEQGLLAARCGGDEFAIWRPNAEAEQSIGWLERLISAPMRVSGVDVRLTATCAASASDLVRGDAAELLRRAESAVRRSKSHVNAAARSYQAQPPRQGRAALSFEAQLRDALESGAVEPFYQPIVDLRAGGRLAGVESLVRWRHPELGVLAPGEFLPLIEELDLLPVIGERMVGQSVQQLQAWRAEGLVDKAFFASVNISSRDLERDRFVADLRALARDHDLEPGALRLEVTESQLMRDPERASASLQRLDAAGVWSSLDDFGTGFSSLAYLQRFPVRTLKIDRYFVRTMGASKESSAIVHAIIGLCRELGKTVVAEGVEDAANAADLISAGCDMAQGYYFGRPESAQALTMRLRERADADADTAGEGALRQAAG